LPLVPEFESLNLNVLPLELKDAIRQIVDGQGGFATQSKHMSDHYRRGGGSGAMLDLNAYLVTRLPATYAAVTACLAVLPGQFSPQSILDAGSGPGTASWAAVQAFPDISNVTFFDNNAKFLELAQSLAVRSSHAALTKSAAIIDDLQRPQENLKADLVIAAYALAELPAATAPKAALALWMACNDILIIIEPGTPQGFERINETRSALIAEGANILAPCTHASKCPMMSPDWCHFKARLARSREHLHAKNAKVPFEDEKYSYVIASRNPAQMAQARILAPPVKTKPEMSFKLCSEAGLTKQSVATRDKAEYKRVRKLEWGDLF
jgi:ribosomal protein RSM22 (predicted rRNA methylase)